MPSLETNLRRNPYGGISPEERLSMSAVVLWRCCLRVCHGTLAVFAIFAFGVTASISDDDSRQSFVVGVKGTNRRIRCEIYLCKSLPV